MSSATSEPVNIRILDREYTVGCEPGERASLTAAANLLDSKMREVRGGNRIAALDRIAVLAALNMAHELQQLREQHDHQDIELRRALDDLQFKLDHVMTASSA